MASKSLNSSGICLLLLLGSCYFADFATAQAVPPKKPATAAPLVLPGAPKPKTAAAPKPAEGAATDNLRHDFSPIAPIIPGPIWKAQISAAARKQGDWIPGRATFYGASKQIEQAYISRGEGAFGIIAYGSCGFTQSDGSLPYPKEVYAAPADTNVDYPGTCGRCYQIRCKTGAVYNGGLPVNIGEHWYMPSVNRTVKDDNGRSWPGNPYEKDGLQYTKCWDDKATVTVRIGDSCPCNQKLPTGEVRKQYWCCGGHNHFDISYWAFQKLAHPLYGVMSMEYRPVDCLTNLPLQPNPGYVSQVIYNGDLRAGWGWRTYGAKNTVLKAAAQGLNGGNGMCATLSKGGAIPLFCRDCNRPGYQPFAKAKVLSFWIRSNTKSSDPFASSTPAGQLPGLKVFLMNDEKSLFCGKEIVLGTTAKQSAKQGDWYKFDLPLAGFNCGSGSSAGSLANINRVDFMNTQLRDANVCLDGIALQ